MSTTLTVKIGGTVVPVIDSSLQIVTRVDDKDKCNFQVYDASGTAVYQKGQTVSVVDTTIGTLFTGFVNKPKATKLYPQSAQLWTVDCVSQFYHVTKHASKKRYHKRSGSGYAAGAILADQIQRYLAPDGVTGNFSLSWAEQQNEWSASTLNNTVAATNVTNGNPSGGNLELASAGGAVTFSQQTQADFNAGFTGGGLTSPSTGGLTFTPTQAIKLVGSESVASISNAHSYMKIWSGSYTIAAGDVLVYDVWIADSCPQQEAAIDFVLTDGTTLRDNQSIVGVDAQGIGPHPNNNLAGLATNTWYHRQFAISGVGSAWVGKTIAYVSVAFEGNNQGAYTAYFRNVLVMNGSTTKLTIFGANATTTQIVPQQLQNSGYINMACTVVTSYERHGYAFSPHFALTSAGIVQSSFVAWSISLPSSAFTFSITAAVDGSATFLPCTLNAAIPGLLPGENAPAYVVFVYVFDNASNDPTLTPLLSRVAGQVNPAYVCSKSDIVSKTNTSTGWSSGTLTNLINSASNTLQINGAARNWDDAGFGSQTTFGTSAAQSVLSKQFQLTSLATNFALSRFDFAGQWADFTAEIDLVATTGVLVGLLYRTGSTALSNNDGCYAYAIELNTTSIKLQRGTNSSGGGTATTVGTATLSLTSGTSYHLKIVVAGSSHTVYLNDTAYITATDATYLAAGYLGVRNRNTLGTAQTATFDNFGVVAALSGTWVSPVIDIHTLGTISDSQITLQIDPGVPLSTNSFLVEISLNNGSTWTTCTNTLTGTSAAFPTLNGGYFQAHAVPGLAAGTNVSGMTQVKIRLTITATTASFGQTVAASAAVVPNITAVTLIVLGSYSSSGTRSNAPLGNDFFARLNQTGWGNSTDQQPWSLVAGTDTPSIASNQGVITTNASAAANRLLLGSGTAADCAGLVRITIGNTADPMGVILRSDATAANHYVGRTTPSSTTQIEIGKRIAGTFTTIATYTSGITVANGSVIWLRFVCQGTTLSVKAWLDGTTEPAAFAGSTTDTALTSGQYGLYCGAAPVAPEKFDHFRATLYPDPTQYLTGAGRATSSLVDHNSILPPNTSVIIKTSIDGGATYQTSQAGSGIPGVATLLYSTLVLQKGANLLRYWHLGEAVGSGTVADSSGNGATGTVHGGVTLGVTGLLQGPGEISNSAASFNGSTGYISSSAAGLPTGSAVWTIVALATMSSVPGSGAQIVAAFGGNTSGTEAALLCLNQHWTLGNGTSNVTASSTVSANTPYLLVGGYDGSKFFLYVNAAPQGTLTASTNTGSAFASIGADTTTPADWFPGTIAEVAFLNAALQQADATALYNAAFAGVGQTNDDTFTTDTHASYINTAGAGGSTATWTWDTANSRVIAAGGSKALLLYNGLYAYDVDLLADFTQSENGGLTWGSQNGSNYYELLVYDGSASSNANTMILNKMSGGTITQLATGAITFPQGTHHRVHVTMMAGIIVAYFDNAQILTYTDVSPFPAGLAGLRNDTGTSYCYLLQIQPLAPDVSGLAVYTKHVLSSTDPTATPQLLDAQTMASDSSFGNGSMIATAEYNQTYISDNTDDLNTQSNYSYSIDFNKNITFTARQAKNAPWILQSTDVFVASATVEYAGDLYRNRQTLKGVYQTSTYTEIKQGDGSTRTWNTANPITAAPTIQLNGMTASVGVLNVDTGKQFYWQVGSTSITQDNSQPILQKNLDSFIVVYTGTSAINFTVDNTGGFPGTISQSQMAALDNSTGVIESIEDVSQKNMNVAAATTYANQLLARYGNIARTITFTTLHAGLKPGHNLPIFIPELNIFDSYFLVVEVTTTARLLANGTIQYVYTCIASEAAALSSWVKFFSKIMRSVK